MTTESVGHGRTFIRRRHREALIAALVVCFLLAAAHWYRGGNWIGADNDDLMRAVQVRDLLQGQAWFDLTQYRMGIAGGTLMHWSRLADAPLAGIQIFLSIFVEGAMAERLTVLVWPVLLVVPLIVAISIAARRLGGASAVVPALVLVGMLVPSIQKFNPGRIDHHNVQITLMAILVSGLLDRRQSPWSFAISGLAAALALAIGAEAAPLVAVVCVLVGLQWVLNGRTARNAAIAFCAAYASGLTIAFFLAIPVSEYGAVHCDTYSSAFFRLGLLGSGGLAALVAGPLKGTLSTRVLGSLVVGALLLVGAVVIAPECLRSPLSDLDPVLRQAWLEQVSEAQSVFDVARLRPYSLGFFYAVPALALIVCVGFFKKGAGSIQLFSVALLLAVSLAISTVQLRAFYFAMIFAVPPLAWFVSIMRARGIAENAKFRDAGGYIVAVLVSLPVFWGVLGMPFHPEFMRGSSVGNEIRAEGCILGEDYADLAGLPEGVVAAVSNVGAEILAYTPHRVLSAPYHRNQDGMLAAHRIFTSSANLAIEPIVASGATYLVVCRVEPETELLIRNAPNGLMADLVEDRIPEYLNKVQSGGAIEVYAVRR